MEADAGTNMDILFAIKEPTLVARLAHKVPEAETERFGRTLGDASAKPLIETPAETLREARNMTDFDSLRDTKIQEIIHTLAKWKKEKRRYLG